MEILVKVAKINKKETFTVKATTSNYFLIKNLIEKEKEKIISKLKQYKSAGLIKSIFYPRNKVLQSDLDALVIKKRLLQNSIEQINSIFLK